MTIHSLKLSRHITVALFRISTFGIIILLGLAYVYQNKSDEATDIPAVNTSMYNLGAVSLPKNSGWIDSKGRWIDSEELQGIDSILGSLTKDSVTVEYDSGIYYIGVNEDEAIYSTEANGVTSSIYEVTVDDSSTYLRIVSYKAGNNPNLTDKFSGIVGNDSSLSKEKLIELANGFELTE
jgi:hypothetical protein